MQYMNTILQYPPTQLGSRNIFLESDIQFSRTLYLLTHFS